MKQTDKMKGHPKKMANSIVVKPKEIPTIPHREIPEIEPDKTKEDPLILPKTPEIIPNTEPFTKPNKHKPEIPDLPEKAPEIPDYPETPDIPDIPDYPETPPEDLH